MTTETMTGRPLPGNAKRVLELLKNANGPLTAYELLDRLRPEGVTAPPTVYRALDRLTESGLVHRLESLNAFVVCDQGKAHGPAAFAVCTRCKRVIEIKSSTVPGYVQGWAEATDFKVESIMIEALGECADCRAQAAPAEAS